MDYVKVAKVADFENCRIKSFKLLARPVAVVKEPDGSFYAIQAGCKHQNADLTAGRIKGDLVVCPWHGWRYNLRTGECLWGSEAKLLRHGLRVDGDDIYVSIRPAEQAPPQEEWEHW